MSISSSLNAGVAGLNAYAARLATISDNIANASTYGYKRAETDFFSMVMANTPQQVYSAGGVRSASMRLIGEQGPLVSTTNATDIALDGRGFLPVTDIAAARSETPGELPVSLVTTGSFRPDSDGILRTAAGQVLMGWPARVDGSIAEVPRDTMAALEPVRIGQNQFVSNPTTQMRLGVNLPADRTLAGATGDPLDLSVEYFDNMGNSNALVFAFTAEVPAAGASNAWGMTITDSATGAEVGSYRLQFSTAPGSGGTLASVTAISGPAYDPASGTVPITLAGNAIRLDLGRPGQADGMTQLSSAFAPVSVSKNGSPVATLTGVEIDERGNLLAMYDQGFTRRLYQIPVVDVPNPNGLIALSDQSYQISPASGAFYLWTAGEGPVGHTIGFSREESATDVAAELTQLIQTQRAYSSNAKVIQTVDEMLQETTNIKR